jgi:cell division protein FtsI/penicillin-binding protein 2
MAEEMNYDWETLLKDKSPDKKFDIFLEKFNIAKEKCIPQTNSRAGKKAKKHKYIPVPLDEKTIKKIKKKRRCWQRYMETRDGKKYQEYVRARNQVKGLVRKTKLEMEKSIARNTKENSKIFWQYANSKRKTKSGIAELKYKDGNGESKTTNGDKEKTEVLTDFFGSVFTEEPDGETPPFSQVHIEKQFEDRWFGENEIRKLLDEINPSKSPGPDGLHPKALRELSKVIARPLLSYSMHLWKLAKYLNCGN